ncbi:MAG: HNH endonuclease [Acidimicrobiales bacterium]
MTRPAQRLTGAGVMTMTATNVYKTAAWKRVRLYVLERDGYLCQLRLKGCLGQANTVDHVVPVNSGGAPFDEANLRSSCRNCNLRRVNRRSDEGWLSARTLITLVVAPPVPRLALDDVLERRRACDLVISYEMIAETCGGNHQATMATRNALLGTLRRGEVGAARAWITSANPQAEAVLPHHHIVVVDPGQDEALRLVAGDGELEAVVRRWYSARGIATTKRNRREW